MGKKVSEDDLTVLNDWTSGNEASHQEIAANLLPRLREEMPEREYREELLDDLRSVVLESIIRDLEANLEYEDWHGMGFEDPADFLDAEEVSEAIGEQAEWYFEDDQTGKSWDILQVILEYAKEYEMVERRSDG